MVLTEFYFSRTELLNMSFSIINLRPSIEVYNYMKKELTYLLAGISFLVILVSVPLSTAVSPLVGVEVGDDFNYVVTDIYFYLEEGLVVTTEETGVGIVNNTINVQVDAIFESADIGYWGLPYPTTTFNVTETLGGQTFLGQTPLDMWYSTFVSIDMLYAILVDGFNPYDPPDVVIDFPDTSTYDFMKGLPIFANTNATFYEHLESQLNAAIYPSFTYDDSINPIINPGIPSNVIEVSFIDGIFKLNVTKQGFIDDGTVTTDVDIDWSVEGVSNYYVEIDVENGLVQVMYYGIKVKTIVDGYSTELAMEVGIERSDSGRTFTLGLSFIEPLLAVLGLTTFYIIVRRIKK